MLMSTPNLSASKPLGRSWARRPGHPAPQPRIPFIEAIVFAMMLVMPVFLPDYLMSLGTRVLLLSLLALSFDLVWGFAGIMSFGQSVFFGVAGYVVAILARDLGISDLALLAPAGILVSLCLSLLVGAFLLLGRNPTSMIFVSLGTLTISYAAERLARGSYSLGGQNGIPSLPVLQLYGYEFSEGPRFYYLAFVALLLSYALCRWLVRSQLGLALTGLRENEARIVFFGYKVQHLKALIFAVSGAIAGLAGSLSAFNDGFVGPNMLGVVMSTQIVLYVLLGGTGTLIGALIGVVAIESASFWLADSYPQIWPVILGMMLLIVVLFRPAGLISFMASKRERTGSFKPTIKKGPQRVAPRG
ncbi:branched-chain amino acid ABC transporter permease [Variovorax sp. J31P207]|uniref:branched-chain amino acid ABC transporter permease n=1 Tax=Variovorax sp. J31P207 TaxID=3053510 RepID=UPI00257790E3|nr:branched-chain amino acid ABC transporter permease [Variovorax sp. J31P207]MDM0069960.1 branched-chain amino acid ABC transporter permease [Variovorax sp. J31P207]